MEILGPYKYNHFVYLTYDTAAHKILCLKTSISNYSDLVFHKYTFGKKCVLYAIENDSSLGSWTDELLLTVLSASDLKQIASECVYYKSHIVGAPPEMECIEYKKDFEFSGNRLHLKGTDFDYHAWKYVPYEKEYRLF